VSKSIPLSTRAILAGQVLGRDHHPEHHPEHHPDHDGALPAELAGPELFGLGSSTPPPGVIPVVTHGASVGPTTMPTKPRSQNQTFTHSQHRRSKRGRQ
jgi:hypothetical protein